MIEHGVRREPAVYVAPADSIGKPDTPWVNICDIDTKVTDELLHGDQLYLLTFDDAPRFKIIRLDLKDPDVKKAETFVPQGKTVLHHIAAAGDALYVSELNAGVFHVLRVPYDGSKPARIPLPFEGTAWLADLDPTEPGASFSLTSWTRGARIYDYDPQSQKLSETDLQPLGPYDNLNDITSVELKVPSYDETLVPMSIVFKKSMKLDGENPAIITAYGGYGITIDPGFNPALLAWLNRGGIFAVAHARGGGELGEEWHRGAYKLTKPNVWRDVIACAQYLIKEKYTSAKKLAVTGGSNGGITVGRAITARPDLFAAASIRAGLVNTLRFETDANGIPNVPEFGSVSTQEGFEDLLAMDAFQHVREGVAYPAVLLTTGINDPRVPPWQPAKLAARLQSATSSKKPVLLSIDYQGGHGVGQSKRQRIDLTADAYAFFLWQFGQTSTATAK